MAKTHKINLLHTLFSLVVLAGVTFVSEAYAQRAIPLPPPPTIIWPDEGPAEPARWTQEDVTQEQKFDTARKEAIAAQKMSLDHCKTLAAPDQALCTAQSKLAFEKELSDIKIKFGILR